jgi:hypothetical protein
MGYPVADSFVDALSTYTHWHSKALLMVPQYLLKVLVRDPLAANFLTPVSPRAKIFTPLHAVYELGKIALRLSKEHKTLRLHGVTGVASSLANPTNFSRALDKANQNKLSLLGSIANSAFAAFDAATRVAIYKAAIRQGREDGITNKQELEDYAALMAREVTNFQTRGGAASAQTVAKVTPFLQSYLNGMDAMIRTAARHNMSRKDAAVMKRKFVQMGTVMAAMTVAHTLANYRDERYRKLPIQDWANNWIMGWDDEGHGLKAPMPFEMGFIFKFIPELLTRRALGVIDEKEGNKAFFDTFLDVMMPPSIQHPILEPTRGYLELTTNTNLFTGNEIESKTEQRLSPQYRDKKASEISRAVVKQLKLSKNFGISPDQFEHWMRSVTGEMGMFAATAAQVMWDKYILNKYENGVPFNKDITEYYPGLRSIMTNPRKNAETPRYYELLSGIDQVVNDVHAANNSKDKTMYDEIMADPENVARLELEAPLKPYRTQIRNIEAKMHELEFGGFDAEKYQQMSNLEKTKIYLNLVKERDEVVSGAIKEYKKHMKSRGIK